MPHTFSLLVPVKTLAISKSRLEVAARDGREPLMRAFALDAITAASASTAVGHLFVVTDEPGFEVAGAVRLPDEGEGDLNIALRHASARVRRAHPRDGVAVLCADLPCLSTDDLQAALAVGLTPRWFVADAAGTGTTMLAAAPGLDLDPHFGVGSARLHEDAGATPVRAELLTLRRDVDTGEDLAQARALGLGPHTAAAMGIGPRKAAGTSA